MSRRGDREQLATGEAAGTGTALEPGNICRPADGWLDSSNSVQWLFSCLMNGARSSVTLSVAVLTCHSLAS